jgi:hypothetical protein
VLELLLREDWSYRISPNVKLILPVGTHREGKLTCLESYESKKRYQRQIEKRTAPKDEALSPRRPLHTLNRFLWRFVHDEKLLVKPLAVTRLAQLGLAAISQTTLVASTHTFAL